MNLQVRIPSALRDVVAGAHAIELDLPHDHVTVVAALDAIALRHPALERRIRDERGSLRTHVNLFIGADNVKDRGGLSARIEPGEELTIIPAISGG